MCQLTLYCDACVSPIEQKLIDRLTGLGYEPVTIERVKDTDKNGYIWHTTGSGKTPSVRD